MGQFWTDDIGLLMDDIGVIECDACPCDVTEPPVVPPEGWCPDQEPPASDFPLFTEIPSLNDWTLTNGLILPFDSVAVSPRQVIATSTTDVLAGTRNFAANLRFDMRLPYLYVTRLYLEMTILHERVSGSHDNLIGHFQLTSHLIDSGNALRTTRHFNIGVGGAPVTRFASTEWLLTGIDEESETCFYVADVTNVFDPSPPGSQEGANASPCIGPCDFRFEFYVQHSHGPPHPAGPSVCRSTIDFAFDIQGSNTLP